MAEAPRRHTIATGVWRVVDPRITLASAASMLVGATAAACAGPMQWGWLGLTMLGIFSVEGAKNASGEIIDWDSGTDAEVNDDERTPFSGGKRVIVDGLLTRQQTAMVAGVFYAIAVVCGVAIVLVREPAVLWLGIVGIAVAFFYHAPPLKLSYRGCGELSVVLTYGPLIAAGTYLVQRHTVDGTVLWAATPLGLAIGAFLLINEFPDARADAMAGKRTLVVRLGRRRAAWWFAVLVAIAYVGVLLLPLAGLPLSVMMGMIGFPHAIAAARRLRHYPETPRELVPAQVWTLLSFVLMALGIGAGFVIAALAR